uniref:Uncharacterized protein n=1 Tax=Steinernema glaseri TaxID=37863 RepID=A0A1I7YA41_9BILA
MDAVPLKFVDSVVELFGERTLDNLAPEVRHPLWKDLFYLHQRNRVIYELLLRKTEDSIKLVFVEPNDEPGRAVNVQEIRKNRRFARIVDVVDRSSLCLFERVPRNQMTNDGTSVLLTSLFRRTYLDRIVLTYRQIAYDFLEDQINNSVFLSIVLLRGHNWPKSSFDHIKKFCLKGKPGRHVCASVEEADAVDNSYIESFFDVWKARGILHFWLTFEHHKLDDERLQSLMSQGEVSEKRPNCRESFFKHETEKSIARIKKNRCFRMECYTCECDRFERCMLKEWCPSHHDF